MTYDMEKPTEISAGRLCVKAAINLKQNSSWQERGDEMAFVNNNPRFLVETGSQLFCVQFARTSPPALLPSFSSFHIYHVQPKISLMQHLICFGNIRSPIYRRLNTAKYGEDRVVSNEDHIYNLQDS